MNPLCCIAPVSVEKDRSSPSLIKQNNNDGIVNGDVVVDAKVVNVNSRQSSSSTSRISSVKDDVDVGGNTSNGNCMEEGKVVGGNNGKNLYMAGVLFKWVNYGKGWRARWFVLEDGVLSYYKVQGPDKIVMNPGKDKGVKVIGEESWRYVRRSNARNGNQNQEFGSKVQWKAFGEVHLKVDSS